MITSLADLEPMTCGDVRRLVLRLCFISRVSHMLKMETSPVLGGLADHDHHDRHKRDRQKRCHVHPRCGQQSAKPASKSQQGNSQP
jgi:hypothetical protein